jgi:putative ABC transport system permease protein
MFQNYLKIAWRSLMKQRFFAGINIVGLATGISCCTLISLFVWNELNYDRYNEKVERIYRVNADIKYGGKAELYAVTQAPLAKALREEVPGVETACRFRQWGSRLVKREGTAQNISEERVVWADQEIFDVFTLPLVGGEKASLLIEPNTLVLSESAARRHFGELNPLGQTLILDNQQRYKIMGVFRDIPQASHFHYDFFLTMKGYDEAESPVWLSHNFNTYLVAKPGSNLADIERSLNLTFRKYASPQVQAAMGATLEELETKGDHAKYTLMPLTDIHLFSDLIAEHEPNGSIQYVWIFSAIALFILLIACINFMNLATARSANRAKEVGMRKVLGSVKKQLVGQFLTEAIVMSGIAFLLSVVLTTAGMPWFRQLTDKKIDLPLTSPAFIGLLLAGALLVGLLAGSYPAFYLSAFKPIQALKGTIFPFKNAGSKGTTWMRNGLVVFQFSISILLIIGTMVIQRQLSFIQNKRLGFDKEQVFVLNDANSMGDKFQGFKEQLKAMSEVKILSATCFLPVNSCRSEESLWLEGKGPEQSTLSIQRWQTDYDYLSTMGMEMKEGRYFSKEFSTDSAAIVLNETAVEKFGFDEAIGQRVVTFTDNTLQQTKTYTVVGVVKDFNFSSLRENIGPLCMVLSDGVSSTVSMRLNAGTDIPAFIEKIKTQWMSLAPGEPFSYAFLDERFERMYSSEQRLSAIFRAFGGLAIFIACLGLLALSAFTAERRTKEIGVRKVLGASTASVVGLLSRQFVSLVVVSLLIASPLAWLFMNKWLQDFAYRIDIQWTVFALAGVVAIVVATFTVAIQSIKAALANPVKSLRSE